MRFRYSRWDGTQEIADLDGDDVLAEVADDLLSHGDLQTALRRLFQRGLQRPQGGRLPGLQDLLKQLQQRRRQQLDRYDLGSAREDAKWIGPAPCHAALEDNPNRIDMSPAMWTARKVAEADKLAKPDNPLPCFGASLTCRNRSGGRSFPSADSGSMNCGSTAVKWAIRSM